MNHVHIFKFTFCAVAFEAVYSVDAETPVPAGIRETFVDVYPAELS